MGGRRTPRAVWAVMAAHLLLLLLVAGRYGFHRDELYFLEAGRHLAFGYVDQPPLVAVLARVQSALLGGSPAALRVVPALVSSATVWLGARLARELRATVRTEVLAAAAVATAPFALASGHLLSTATFDFAFWLAALVVVARILRTGDPRGWIPFGVVVGVAMWNKQLIPLLAVSIVAGLAVERRWDLLAWRWLAAGAAVAVAIASPTIVWQATHGWPQVEMAGALADRIGAENRTLLVPMQVLLVGPVLVGVSVSGLRWLHRRSAGGATFRPLLWAYVVALLLTLASGGRPYYPLPLAVVALVAGIVAWQASPRRLVSLLVVDALVAIPLSLPVLPVRLVADSPIGEINDTLVETIGWPELATQVAQVVADLPADQRDDVVLLTGSYGEAGALDRYGPALGLPEAHSGHNSYWHWRQPTDARATVVAVRLGAQTLDPLFETCTQVDEVDNGRGVDNEVQGAPIVVCTGLRGTWDDAWPALRHVN